MQKILRITSENIDSEIGNITDFYNENFSKARHEKKYKKYMYTKNDYQAVILTINFKGEIIGLLESWLLLKRPGFRILTTLLIKDSFRNHGLASKLITELFELTKNEGCALIVNFRENNKTTHEKFYQKFGFCNLALVGKYANGDNMWEMQKIT